jgi:hypothetical protein
MSIRFRNEEWHPSQTLPAAIRSWPIVLVSADAEGAGCISAENNNGNPVGLGGRTGVESAASEKPPGIQNL